MNSEMKYNAPHSVAKRCNEAIKSMDKNNLPDLTEAFSRFAVDVKLLGFTMLDMKIEIGVITGTKTVIDGELLAAKVQTIIDILD